MNLPKGQIPISDRLQNALADIQIPEDQTHAKAFHNRLLTWFAAFDTSLDSEHEIGARLVNFGQTYTFRVTDLGYWNPSLIVFHGFNDQGERIQLIQHVSQISILLVPLKKPGDRPRIGFAAGTETE